MASVIALLQEMRTNLTDDNRRLLKTELTQPQSMHLSLFNQALEPTDIENLVLALKDNTSVVSLNLMHNKIGDAGIKILAKFLETNTSLRSVYIKYNNITDEGAAVLQKSLTKNKTLLSLDKFQDFFIVDANSLFNNLQVSNKDYYIQINASHLQSLEASRTLAFHWDEGNKITQNIKIEIEKVLANNRLEYAKKCLSQPGLNTIIPLDIGLAHDGVKPNKKFRSKNKLNQPKLDPVVNIPNAHFQLEPGALESASNAQSQSEFNASPEYKKNKTQDLNSSKTVIGTVLVAALAIIAISSLLSTMLTLLLLVGLVSGGLVMLPKISPEKFKESLIVYGDTLFPANGNNTSAAPPATVRLKPSIKPETKTGDENGSVDNTLSSPSQNLAQSSSGQSAGAKRRRVG